MLISPCVSIQARDCNFKGILHVAEIRLISHYDINQIRLEHFNKIHAPMMTSNIPVPPTYFKFLSETPNSIETSFFIEVKAVKSNPDTIKITPIN